MQDILFLLNSQGFTPGIKFIIIVLSILAMVIVLTLKGYSLWYASRHNNYKWFISLLILNTFGVLELVYLLGFEKDKKLKNFIQTEFKKIKHFVQSKFDRN